MDGTRFDELTRGLAGARTRRGVLRALGAGVLAALGLAAPAAADGCKAAGKACSKGSQCCSGLCASATGKTSVAGSGSVCAPDACGGCTGGRVCTGGACVCPAGQIDCGAGCIPGDCCYVQGPFNHPVFGTVYVDPRCDDGIPCTFDTCIDHQCVHFDLPCNDGRDCTTDFCDHELKQCVNVPIGGAPRLLQGMCELGEFFPDGQPCEADTFGADGGSGLCESQYCDPDTGLCAPNPGGDCTKQGLACTSDGECCFGLPCTRGYCWDGNPTM